jgi:hypothetical protein
VIPKISLLPNSSQKTKKEKAEVRTLAANKTDHNLQSLVDNPEMQRTPGLAKVLPPPIVKEADQDSRRET